MEVFNGSLGCSGCGSLIQVQHIFPNVEGELGVLCGYCENCDIKWTLDINYPKD